MLEEIDSEEADPVEEIARAFEEALEETEREEEESIQNPTLISDE